MARGDIDVDRQKRGDKVARESQTDSGVSTAIQVALSPLVLADTIKNSALAKDKELMKELRKSLENYPDSVYENQVEGIDVVTSWLPEWSARNPSASAGLGVLLDLVDPISLGATKGASKVGAKTLTSTIQNKADKMANTFAGKHLKSLSKRKNMELVPQLEEIVKRYNLRGELAEPEKLMDKVKGKVGAIVEGEGDAAVIKRNVLTKGILSETGEKLRKTVKQGSKTAPKVDRTKIRDTLLTEKEAIARDTSKAGIPDLSSYKKFLDENLKPTTKKKITVPKKAKTPELTPKIPMDDFSERLRKLQQEYDLVRSRSEVPPIPRDAINPDLPPEIPLRSLDEIGLDRRALKDEFTQARRANANIDRQNAREITRASKAPGVEVMEVEEPIISSVQSLWDLKQSLQDKISDPQWARALEQSPQLVQDTRKLIQEIDKNIIDSLSKVNLPEGNAGDIYRGLNNDFSLQSQLLELIRTDVMREWREQPFDAMRVMPSLASAGAMQLAGGNVTNVATAGMAGELARRTFMETSHAKLARMADRLSQFGPAYTAGQLATEGAEKGAEALGIVPDRAEPQDFSHIPLSEEGSDPELMKLLRGNQGRSPDSVVEAPQDVMEAVDIMAPQEPLPMEDMTPEEIEAQFPSSSMWQRPEMINEELLNTPLPRNSQRLMENPNVLIAKARQADPRAGEIVQDMIFNDPEGLIKNGGKVAGMFPHLFERDEYNSFDGKIEDPEMRVKFLKDLSADSSMTSIEKAKLANKLHRNQSIY